ncbi:DNA topoisomerase IB [Microbacterium sp. M3]|uniref:DNA topoisomerase n=1 Tax=Microbacterium arthrosphaerae TaxID=792652 RepID=A0ABU4H4S7_9MICO|nr:MULTISPECIES: DNA topoisomerase IB [Microbacterium]MDW4574331.1 DNA topoisomerase IB [Microbacterium arthrosphaerae]MDW7608186.1 DNA topoisomerase IB [Microbacterium sp. M3]
MPRLARVRPLEDPGFRRVRSGAGFRYLDARGRAPGRRHLERIQALVIPPAWNDVWISERPDGHIQAVGTDDAGRRQYIYHAEWAAGRDKGKFARALALAEALPRARARVTTSLRREALDRERVLAVAFRLLDDAAPRIGSERYLAAHGSRGLTTLQRRDASVAASAITFAFPGKSGKRQLLEIDDADLAAAIELLAAGRPRSPLLAWDRGGRRVPLTPAEVNAYIRTLTGARFTAKDFRTLRGTILAADALARIGTVDTKTDLKRAEVLAVRATAEALGNTPSVARGSYIDPRVFARYRDGHLLDLSKTPESAIRALLRPGR